VPLLINGILIILVNSFLGLVAAALYLGSIEQHLELQKHLFHSYVERFFPIWVIGVLFGLVLMGINLILSTLKIIQITKKQVGLLFLFSIIASTILIFLGTSYFFSG
jgi:hypothetical protein